MASGLLQESCIGGLGVCMAQSAQDVLQEAWLGGRTGNLSAWSEAKLWAAREVWRVQQESKYGLVSFAAGLVKKHGTFKPYRTFRLS